MLSFPEFFAACTGLWTTERTYHMPLRSEIERSHTEFQVTALSLEQKQAISTLSDNSSLQFDLNALVQDPEIWPGFAISFNTESEKGEKVAMSLQALFVPEQYVTGLAQLAMPALPLAAQVALQPDREIIQGVYLRNEGYSESGTIAGRFTYQPTRQTLEMTTYYRRSVAVDQMRFIAPTTRLRTIVTYQRPQDPAGVPPSVIDLIGFGVEYKHSI